MQQVPTLLCSQAPAAVCAWGRVRARRSRVAVAGPPGGPPPLLPPAAERRRTGPARDRAGTRTRASPTSKETRTLLDGIDVTNLVDLRDRAFLGVLIYSFARASAAVPLRVADYYAQGPRSFFRLHEKGGRYNVVPAHHVAQGYVDAYLEAARIGEDRRGPLFRSWEPRRRDVL